MKLRSLLLPLGLLLGFQTSRPAQVADAPRPPVVGEALPTFRLNDQSGQIVTVGGERDDWTVLAFYPKAMTPG